MADAQVIIGGIVELLIDLWHSETFPHGQHRTFLPDWCELYDALQKQTGTIYATPTDPVAELFYCNFVMPEIK